MKLTSLLILTGTLLLLTPTAGHARIGDTLGEANERYGALRSKRILYWPKTTVELIKYEFNGIDITIYFIDKRAEAIIYHDKLDRTNRTEDKLGQRGNLNESSALVLLFNNKLKSSVWKEANVRENRPANVREYLNQSETSDDFRLAEFSQTTDTEFRNATLTIKSKTFLEIENRLSGF